MGYLANARCFLLFAAGYFYSFLFRNVNSVVSPKLTQQFALSPGTVGLRTSAYFATFSLVFAVQFGVGAIINLWSVVDGRYALAGYRTSFVLFWVLQVALVAWLVYAENAAVRKPA